MKNLIIATAVALTATVAVAGGNLNLRKVNKNIAAAIQPELTPLISQMELKFDERSKLDNVAKLNVAAGITATAKGSKWSQSPTSLEVKAAVKTLSSDTKNSRMSAKASLGSKTDAVALYAYTAKYLKDYEDNGAVPTEADKDFSAWLKTAAETKSLNEIPAQLEQLIVIIKKYLNETTPDQDWSAYVKLVDSLKVEKSLIAQEVVLRTTEAVTIDDVVVSNLSFKISRTGLSLNGQVDFSVPTESATQFLETVKGFLETVQNADEETLKGLQEMARDYVQAADDFVNGKN
jgi:hypothetical protein